jgi:hypothetical protein
VVFGGVFGLAASLNVSSDTLGAGTTVVAACQTGTLTASYATGYDATASGYKVTAVNFSGLQSGCYGKSFKLTLSSAGGSLGEITGTTPSSGSTIAVDVSSVTPAVLASAVTGANLLIVG